MYHSLRCRYLQSDNVGQVLLFLQDTTPYGVYTCSQTNIGQVLLFPQDTTRYSVDTYSPTNVDVVCLIQGGSAPNSHVLFARIKAQFTARHHMNIAHKRLLTEVVLFVTIIRRKPSQSGLSMFVCEDATPVAHFPFKACLSIHLCQRKHRNQKPSLFMKFRSYRGELNFLLGAINLGNVCKEIQDTAGVTPLVVIPGDELDEVVVE